MPSKRIRAAYEITKGCGCRGVVAGQIADIEAEDKSCSQEMLDFIHVNKTAAMIVAAIRAGAWMGNPDPEMMENLTIYAENLGLAFQIRDDILDVIGDEAELGKKTGHDSETMKATYPALYGIDESLKRLKELTDTAINALAGYYDNAELFTDLARQLEVRGN